MISFNEKSSTCDKIESLWYDWVTARYHNFELLLHTRQGLWSPSSMQEFSSFHLVDPNSGGVMMIVMSDMWDVKKMFGIIV